MQAIFLFVLVFHGIVTSAAPNKCMFPEFSHKNERTSFWLAERGRHQQTVSERSRHSRHWSKYGKVSSPVAVGNTNSISEDSEEFLNWLYGGKDADISKKFLLVPRERPNIKNEATLIRGNNGQTSVAAMDLKAQDTLLEISMDYCLSDEILRDDPPSLKGSPWELRLATKILRERSKYKDSFWYPFINVLPSFVRLPMFFSEAELYDCEDDYITREVHILRDFAEASFHALYQHETAGANFQDFVWALAIVYTSACKRDGLNPDADVHGHSSHLLVPFFGTWSSFSSATDRRLGLTSQAFIELHGKKLKVVLREEAAQGSLIELANHADRFSDNFVYHGFVPTDLPHDRARVFKDLEDFVDWFLSVLGMEKNSKETMKRHAEAALYALGVNLMPANGTLSSQPTRRETAQSKADYSVGLDGYIDPHMICVLVTLLHSNQINIYEETVFDFEDATVEGAGDFLHSWSIASNESIFPRNLVEAFCTKENENVVDNVYQKAQALTVWVLQKRLVALLNSFSTLLEEDEVLLHASSWEGFNDDSENHKCEDCQWQTDEISLNNYLVVQLRIRRKLMLLHALSMLSGKSAVKNGLFPELEGNSATINDHRNSNVQFLKWCEEQGANVSEKVSIVHFHSEASPTSSSALVRGVQALQDIEEGDTICILPLKMALFNEDSYGTTAADSWHLAAARLLQEKSLGTNSRWASYISVLPQTMPTPIYLNPHELKEVQWWPVLRELVLVRQAIKKSFSQLTGPKLAWADFEEYRWAATMVHSRAFTLPVRDDEQYAPYVLMPFMDMINHHFEYQADWMSLPVREGKLEIVARRHVDKGQQLYASFGPRSNDNLFLYYGFVLENNPFDSAQIFSSFQDGVHWFTNLWILECDKVSNAAEKESCRQKEQEQQWTRAKAAIDDYAAGITEQISEWWSLVNTWAEYGYEYMQFQPSPSIYAGNIVDPSLLIAIETIVNAPEFPRFGRQYAPEDCNPGACNSTCLVKSNLKDFLMCMGSTPWVNGKSAVHSPLCWKSLSLALGAVDKQSYASLLVKVSLAVRCLEILNSFPTTINEDRLLLEDSHANMSHNTSISLHINLTRRYRYVKKLFLKDYIDHIVLFF